jgi:hypothetical protein
MRTALLCVLLLGACPHPTPVPVPPPGVATCVDVCGHYVELGCLAGTPTAEGTTCAAVCNNVQSSGIVSWNLDCRVRAKTCAEAEQCERK